MQKIAFALLICLAATIQTSVGMRCYSCNSRASSACGDPFNSNHSTGTDCTVDLARRVVKVVGTAVDHLWNSANGKDKPEMKQMCFKFATDDGEIYRECGAGNEADWCASLKRTYEGGDKFSCSACPDELCNSGYTLHAFSGFILASCALIMGRYI